LLFHNFLSDVHVELSHSCRPFLCALLEVSLLLSLSFLFPSLWLWLFLVLSALLLNSNLFR
jgi:hypothetical protein